MEIINPTFTSIGGFGQYTLHVERKWHLLVAYTPLFQIQLLLGQRSFPAVAARPVYLPYCT